MKFSTGQRRRSRLQGHRKRRRKLKVSEDPLQASASVGWMEYKTMRQYPSMGDMLDQMRQYGYRGGIESIIETGWGPGEDGFQDITLEDFIVK